MSKVIEIETPETAFRRWYTDADCPPALTLRVGESRVVALVADRYAMWEWLDAAEGAGRVSRTAVADGVEAWCLHLSLPGLMPVVVSAVVAAGVVEDWEARQVAALESVMVSGGAA